MVGVIANWKSKEMREARVTRQALDGERMDGRPGSGGPSNPRMGGLPSTDTPSLARSKKLGGCLLFGLARRRPRLTTTRTNRRHTPLGSVCVRVGAGRHRHRLGMTMSSQERRPAVLRALAGSQEGTRPSRGSSDGALVDGSEWLVREGREAPGSSRLPLTLLLFADSWPWLRRPVTGSPPFKGAEDAIQFSILR